MAGQSPALQDQYSAEQCGSLRYRADTLSEQWLNRERRLRERRGRSWRSKRRGTIPPRKTCQVRLMAGNSVAHGQRNEVVLSVSLDKMLGVRVLEEK